MLHLYNTDWSDVMLNAMACCPLGPAVFLIPISRAMNPSPVTAAKLLHHIVNFCDKCVTSTPVTKKKKKIGEKILLTIFL